MSDVVTYEVRDRKAYITLNRPERLNAIETSCRARSPRPSTGERRHPSSRSSSCGARAGAFCSGYDLKFFAEGGERSGGGRERFGTRSPTTAEMKAEHRRLLRALALAEADHRKVQAMQSPAAATSPSAATWW